LLAALAFLAVAPGWVSAQTFGGWVGLFDTEMLRWLENENQLSDRCGDAGPDIDACYIRTLAPLVRVFTARIEPSDEAARIGDIIVVATPGRGLSAHVRIGDDAEPVPWRPDLFDVDWGYGPYMHQTFVTQYGNWFLLPREPFATPVWLEVSADEIGPRIREIGAGDIVELDGAGWFVIGADAQGLTLRPEQPADMWCEEGDPPAIEPDPGRRFDRADLLDESGHLRLRPKYLRGC
jgi:hypothetical protein